MRASLRTVIAASALLIGGLGFGATPAGAQVRGTTSTAPRYDDSPRYYGYGYIPYASPSSVPAYRGGSSRYDSGPRTTRSERDWSTGRSVPLAKPWLRPLND